MKTESKRTAKKNQTREKRGGAEAKCERHTTHRFNRQFSTNSMNCDADFQTNILETYACRQDMYTQYLNTRTTLLQTRLNEKKKIVNIGSIHRLTKKYASTGEM